MIIMETAIQYYQDKLSFEMDPSDLFDLLEGKDNIIVIDARKDFAFEREHIPGAINLPHRMMNSVSTAKLDKRGLYVVYCDGIGCNASTKGALNLAKLGFSVKELIGGITWWKFDGYATEVSAEVEKSDIQCAC
ncbi:rhodanese-like domain-containing protein [Pedobacter sp. PAMC26386]|nr:rhodanese-like domain-containing protein [Pedobacter sp. PAMC26386]